MKIDAHQHFWEYDPVRDGWITAEMQVIRRDFLPEDLKPILDLHELDGCVVVQADQSERETQWLLDLSQAHSWIKGVVGWLDLKAEDLQLKLAQYQQHPQFKGVRHILQAEKEGFMTDPSFVKGVSEVGNHNLAYDILTTEAQLEEVLALISMLPEMPLVIDHLSKPNIAQGSYAHWAKYMRLLSERPNIYVKLSGMVTEADWQHWSADDLRPYVDLCLECFGPGRLMYGSDWPVCLLAGSYDQVSSAFRSCIGTLSVSEQNAIYGETASEFYKLKG